MYEVNIDGKTHKIDLEAKIMNSWALVDELALLNQAILEKNLTPDQISNILLGLQGLYQLKFEALFSDYEKLVQAQFKTK